MNPLTLLLLVVLSGLLWSVPAKWALVPFFAGCCFTTIGQALELGPINLPVFRILILIGIMRVFAKGERITGNINSIDKLMIAWGVWYAFAGLFHDPECDAGPVYSAGVVYNTLGFYFLVRVWCKDLEDMSGIIRVTAILLTPIALEMISEKLTAKNLFSVFGGVPETVLLREGRLRAQGPFLHPILAGTVGATCIPLFIGILRRHRTMAVLGIAVSLVMVFTSASSGPIMSLMAGCFALGVWKIRNFTGMLRLGFVLVYVVLIFAMKSPPYYLISKIDLSGGSTGWHRSYLIEMTIAHFSEWWLIGTDYTKQWMPNQGQAMSRTHTDITNYYIGFAVGSGILGMGLIIAILGKSFACVGPLYRSIIGENPDRAFTIWCFGSALFAHAVTGISVSYFDQSVVFLWLNVAVISSMYSAMHLGDGLRSEPTVSGDEPGNTAEAGYESRRWSYGNRRAVMPDEPSGRIQNRKFEGVAALGSADMPEKQ